MPISNTLVCPTSTNKKIFSKVPCNQLEGCWRTFFRYTTW